MTGVERSVKMSMEYVDTNKLHITKLIKRERWSATAASVSFVMIL